MANKSINALIFEGNENTYLDKYVQVIGNPETAKKLALISATEAVTAFAGIKQAYFMAQVTDVDAKKEQFKSATEMIEKVCGLKKSMISNYRIVGAMVTDANGNFAVPDELKGFSVTQLVEARAKLKDTEKVIASVKENEIACTMSAKDIREKLSTVEEKEEAKTKRERDKRAAQAKTAKEYAGKHGLPVKYTNEDGEDEIIGYIVATVAMTAFADIMNGGHAFCDTASGNRFSITGPVQIEQ